MNHSFIQANDGTDKCAKCKFPSVSHGNEGICDCCPAIGIVEIRYGNMLMCDTCWKKEQDTHNETMKPENQQARVNAMNAAIVESRKLDSSIQVRSDLFNAATMSIVELKKLIDDNPSISNKPYALAETLTERFTHFRKVIFDANESIIQATNNQQAIQVYLNNLANSLRVEEREKLKLSDINYKPGSVKPVKTPTIKTRKIGKLDKKELDKYAKELGVSAFTLQMLCVSQGITPEQAANKLRRSIKESLSESTPKVDDSPIVDMDTEAE